MKTNSSCSADVSRYNLPQATGTTLTPELMKRIQEGVPSLMGLKHSASDSQVGLVSAYIGELSNKQLSFTPGCNLRSSSHQMMLCAWYTRL